MRIGWSVVAISLWLASPWSGGAGLARAEEADPGPQIKAAFVLNFLKFVEWPAEIPGGESGELVLAVVGEDPIAPAIQATVEGQRVQQRTVRVHTYADPAAWVENETVWHAVFLTPAAGRAWSLLRAAVADRPVVTIAAQSGFCAGGGMLNLVEQDGRVRFEANPGAAREVGLKLRADLLKLATIVRTRTEGKP